jgi:hypothetical protein
MTTPNTPLLARLAALQAGVALNPGMVEASNVSRWREALAVIQEMAKELELIRIQLAATAQIAAVVASVNKTVSGRMEACETRADILDDSFRRADVYFKSMAETISALRQEYAEVKERLAAFEAWRESMTGDGK